MAVFLERGMHGSGYNPGPGTGNIFLDVPASYWAGGWIEQLYMDGITAGCGSNNYCPGDSTNRAQMAVFLLRAEHGQDYVPPTPVGVFNDVPLTYWAAGWIEQLAAEGITSGCGGGNYCPNDSVNRAQMAVFLVRTFGLTCCVTNPLPESLDPSALTDTSVTLNGLFTNPAGDTTTVWFEYGLTDAYGNSTPSAMYAADATIDHTADLSSLTNRTIYHYRIVTQNSMGVFYGDDKTFRTYISAVTLANNLNAPTSLHLHNNELYWVEVYDDDVMKISTSGGTAVIEASSAIAGNSATLVMDMTDLYWSDWANIWTKPIGTGAVAPVATSLNSYDFYGLVEVYATDLYAMSGVGNTSNSIDKIAISDGSVSHIITLPWYSRASIEVDATGVYWTNIPDAVIGKSQHDGSSEVTLAVGLNSPHSLILDSGVLYWAESNAIKSMSTSGGAITTIAENVSPALMTKDSTNFYFSEEVGYPAYHEHYIKSVNISSGVVEVLSKIDLSSNNYIRGIVVDDTHLYLLISGNQYYPPLGKILKYEKSY